MVKVKPSMWPTWMVILLALVESHDILILGKTSIQWRQRPDMTIALDWGVKHQFKQTSLIFCKHNLSLLENVSPCDRIATKIRCSTFTKGSTSNTLPVKLGALQNKPSTHQKAIRYPKFQILAPDRYNFQRVENLIYD